MSYFHWKLVVFFYRVSLLTAGSYSGADCLGKSLLHKGLAVLRVRPVGSSAVAAVLPPVEVGVA